MTTIAIYKGVMASDSQITTESEAGGSRKFNCTKMYPVTTKRGGRAIIAVSGETFAGLVFVDWYVSGKKKGSDRLLLGEADFSAIVMRADGLYEYDKWCRGEKIEEKYYAIGSGAKAALGAMRAGCSATLAIEIACEIDTYSRPPVISMNLDMDDLFNEKV